MYFYFMGYCNTFEKKESKSGVTELINFLGPNLSQHPFISCIILYKKLQAEKFGHFDDAPFL